MAFAERLGKRLRGGEVIELISDLGGGKTTFVRGLARGIGSQDQVTSPTFTINNVYQGAKLTLYHFDFYRLSEPGVMRDELAEILQDPQAVTVIEWGEMVHDVLPNDKLTMTITATGETSRHYECVATGNAVQLVKELN